MNKDIKLGMEVKKVQSTYEFRMDKIKKVLNNDYSDSYGVLEILKPLWDEFGYKKVNTLLKEIIEEEAKDE